MMRTIGLIGSFAALLVSAPLAAQGFKFRTDDRIQSGQRPTATQDQRNRGDDRIPPGHRPPAGMCRIWIDGVPPGRQPAATDCQTAVATKPANARVIWGDQTPFPGKGKDKARNDGRVDDDDDDDKQSENRAKKSDRRDDDDKKLKSGKKSEKKGHGRGHK